jgi:transcriptional regulator with XRE-family HTH domain
MKDRLLQIRKETALTQGEFGKMIGLTDPMISLFESGKKVPKDNTIKLICYTFNVREDWLRYGTGEMFNPPIGSQSSDEARLLSMFRTLTAEMKQVVLQKVRELLAADASWSASIPESRYNNEIPQSPEKGERAAG